MAIRPIVTAPDPRLKVVSKPVEKIDDKIQTLVADMFETMYDAPGIGLAAIQVDVPKRILVCDVSAEEEEPRPMSFINPEIIWHSEQLNLYSEGCLSVPEQYAEVERPTEVRIRYLDLEGNQQEILADGLLATCVQHEIDHLDGVLFIDHLSKLKRDIIVRKLAKVKKLEAVS